MRQEYLYPKRLPPVLAAVAVLGGLWLLPGVGPIQKAAATVAGLAVGCLSGYFEWRRVTRRIFAGNRVILYFTDGLTYALLVQAALLSFFPLVWLEAARMVERFPNVFLLLVFGLTSFALGMSLVTYMQTRRHERCSGPLRATTFYSRSITGPQGMLGRRAVVQAGCSPEGMVEVAGELWRARSLGETILVGESVVVRDIEGLCLLVEKLDSGTA